MNPNYQNIVELVRQGLTWPHACLASGIGWNDFLKTLEQGRLHPDSEQGAFVLNLAEAGVKATEDHLKSQMESIKRLMDYGV